MNTKTNISQNRFRTIDGLRGIAAMGVVLFHLSRNLNPELSTLLPEAVNVIFFYGYLGVPIFFVISGLVISLSIKDSNVTLNYAGNFILRRSIRLDPTYWASIAFAIVLLSLKNQFLGGSEPLPSSPSILAHMLYLQDLLSVKPVISVVYWTLCLEVQFYLFYLFTLFLSQRASSALGCSSHAIHLLIITSVGLYSILLDLGTLSPLLKGLFIGNWHYFVLGILVSNAIRKKPGSHYVFFTWIALELAFQLGLHIKAYTVAGVICSLMVYFLWRNDLLDKYLTGPVFQFLGKISYTLYLIHPDIGWKIISFGKYLLGDNMTPWLAGALLIAGILVSVAIAYLFHLAFERPSLWLCSQLKSTSIKVFLSPPFR